jgi:hypothetical protein
LLPEVREMIPTARERLARQVDSGLVTLYWSLGRRIRQDALQERRAEYGERIVSSLGTRLEAEFGRGFGKRNLFRMIRFAEVFADLEIVSALRSQLGGTHFRPGDKGRMELYLRWLDKHERREVEETPIGLILCAGRKQETVRLLDLEASDIRVASCRTEALPREQLVRKLHQAVRLARERLPASAADPATKRHEDES